MNIVHWTHWNAHSVYFDNLHVSNCWNAWLFMSQNTRLLVNYSKTNQFSSLILSRILASSKNMRPNFKSQFLTFSPMVSSTYQALGLKSLEIKNNLSPNWILSSGHDQFEKSKSKFRIILAFARTNIIGSVESYRLRLIHEDYCRFCITGCDSQEFGAWTSGQTAGSPNRPEGDVRLELLLIFTGPLSWRESLLTK